MPRDWTLDRAVVSFRDLDVPAVALHRGATAAEAAALAALARSVPIVAVFAWQPGLAAPLLVVDGAPADEDREASLDRLCRELHGLQSPRVALRCSEEPGGHPAPDEIVHVADAVRHAGYWHDPARATEAHLDAAGRHLFGASFHPLRVDDLRGLRDALPASAPAVVACAPGTSKEEVREALRCARGVFRD